MKRINTPRINSVSRRLRRLFGLAAWAPAAALALALTGSAAAENQFAPIPFSEIGARATADYQGDALAMVATAKGARLRCGFQKLEGRATVEGLWIESTEPGAGRLRLVGSAVNREVLESGSPLPLWVEAGAFQRGRALPQSRTLSRSSPLLRVVGDGVLAGVGTVSVEGKLVRWVRAGLVEEYSASVDGVRQDFAVTERPAGAGKLRVELALSGARAEAAPYGVRLTLEGSRRVLAYSRLGVADATGQELTARLEVLAADRLAVVVEDAAAVYPVRIDPTFSDANWVSLGGLLGADGEVHAVALDGSGNLYVGGDFTVIGTVVGNHIAKWNGSAWSSLGSGLNGSVYALAVSGPDLYVGGFFTYATNSGPPPVAVNNIAHWDGNSWSALGSGLNYFVYALAVSGPGLYAGGMFTAAGGSAASHIARWNGNTWSAVGSGLNNYVFALAVADTGEVYAGGTFTYATNAGPTPVKVNRVAKWNGTDWLPIELGVDTTVYALAASGPDLYVGGYFRWATNADSTTLTVNHIARWNGNEWLPLGSGMDNTVSGLAMSGSELYAAGYFGTAGGNVANHVAKWNGSTWSALGSGMDNNAYPIAVSGTDLYVGGYFTAAGGKEALGIARWSGSAWSALGPQSAAVNDYVFAVAVSDTDLYVGGDFTAAGGKAVNFIARWNGSEWFALGSGVNGAVQALAVSGTHLYVGGHFTAAGGNPAKYVAHWNGSEWFDLGLGMNGDVYALAVSDTYLYAGGIFTQAGENTACRIAKWNGSVWSAVGVGMDNAVFALAASDTALYAGGWFNYATNAGVGDVKVNHVAKLDGSTWSALGLGVSGTVRALAVSGGDVYVGGDFTYATNADLAAVKVNCIARWDGGVWYPLGGGLSGLVRSLAVSGADLYAAGHFPWATNAGAPGIVVNYIAKWNGTVWSPLGSGLNTAVYALALSGTDLYAGGLFTTAGGKSAAYVAKAVVVCGPGHGTAITAANGVASMWFCGTPTYPYDVQRTTSLIDPVVWTALTPDAPLMPGPDGCFSFTDPDAPSGFAYYRSVPR